MQTQAHGYYKFKEDCLAAFDRLAGELRRRRQLLDPLSAFDALTDTYGSFVEGFSEFRSDAISEWVADRARQGRLFWREPYLSVRRRYKEGAPLDEIDGLHPRALELLQQRLGDRRPYHHQSEAMRRSLAGRNVIVATGTGSGKSFSFYVPVVSTAMEAARRGHAGVKAVLVYPMNALGERPVRGAGRAPCRERAQGVQLHRRPSAQQGQGARGLRGALRPQGAAGLRGDRPQDAA